MNANSEFNIDSKYEEACTVQFKRAINVVLDLNGEIVTSDDADWVRIMIPGDPLNIIETIVTDEHKMRFPKAWAEYQGMGNSGQNGTPLDQWDVHPNMIKVLKDLGFSTVEQLANAGENTLSRIQGGWGWKAKAAKWLESKSPKVADEIAEMKKENAELRQMVEQLLAKKAS